MPSAVDSSVARNSDSERLASTSASRLWLMSSTKATMYKGSPLAARTIDTVRFTQMTPPSLRM